MNNTDKLKPIMRCGAGCGTAHDCAFPDCVDIEATLETLKARESEIAELTKQRDELKNASLKLVKVFNKAPENAELFIAAIEDGFIEFEEALSTQEANKDEDGPLCDHGVKYHECKHDCIQF